MTEATRCNRDPKAAEAKRRDRRGGAAAHEECRGCSSLRVRGEELTMKFHGFEFQSLGGEKRCSLKTERKEIHPLYIPSEVTRYINNTQGNF